MKTTASSHTALLVFGGILAAVGSTIPSPGGRLLCLVAAGFVACFALFRGRSRVERAVASLVLLFVLVQAAYAWRPYLTSLERYRTGASGNGTNERPE